MKRLVCVALTCCLLAAARAQSGPDDPNGDRPYAALRANMGKLLSSFRSLGDWDAHRVLMMDSLEKVYARNGWTSEADAFSLDLVREVNMIPPWSPVERLNKAMEIISDRYLLDEQQERLLRSTMIREATGVFMRHSAEIATYAGEAIRARAAGEAFTPEEVARWAKLAQPVIDDVRQRTNVMSQELMGSLDPQQRELVQVDLDALNRRMDTIQKLDAQWARGEWQPSDWGMEDDPIQLAGKTAAGSGSAANAAAGEGQAPGGAALSPDGAAAPSDNPGGDAQGRTAKAAPSGAPDSDPWTAYVRRFIRKYKLNQAQQARAWKIHGDVRTRAENLRRAYAEQLAAARGRNGAPSTAAGAAKLKEMEAQQTATMNRLFEQMCRRLERLPTRSQRAHADPVALESPEKPAQPAHSTPAKKHP